MIATIVIFGKSSVGFCILLPFIITILSFSIN